MNKIYILYKLIPFINNSFEDTLNEFIKYISKKYNIKKIDYKKNRISPDKCSMVNFNGDFSPLNEIFIKLIFTNKYFSLVGGKDQHYCTCYIDVDNEIEIHWDTNYNYMSNPIEFTQSMYRKEKLINLNEKK